MFSSLTKRQKEILDYIKVTTEINGYSPSLKEIKNHFNLSAISTVHEHIQTLVAKGFLSKEAYKSRGLRIVNSKIENNQFAEVPIVGEIYNEYKVLPTKHAESVFLHYSVLKNKGSFFGLRLKTDLLDKFATKTGDLLIFLETKVANEGSIVVCELSEDKYFGLLSFRNNQNCIDSLSESSVQLKNVTLIGKFTTLLRF